MGQGMVIGGKGNLSQRTQRESVLRIFEYKNSQHNCSSPDSEQNFMLRPRATQGKPDQEKNVGSEAENNLVWAVGC